MKDFLNSPPVQAVTTLRLPRYNELPSLGLYLDQVIFVTDDALRPLYPTADKAVLTPTMVNNYVKQKVVAPPVRKRYSRDHVAYFLVVALLKQVFSIAEISQLFRWQRNSYSVEEAYNSFCSELEHALRAAFSAGARPDGAMPDSGTVRELLRSMVMCLVNKVYVEKYMEYQALCRAENEPQPAEKPEKGEKKERS